MENAHRDRGAAPTSRRGWDLDNGPAELGWHLNAFRGTLANGRFGLGNRDSERHQRAIAVRLDLHRAMETMNPLTHAANAYASALRLNAGQSFRRNSLTLIVDLEAQLGAIDPHSDFRGLASRVPVNVRKAFLYQSKHHQFHFVPESSKVVWHIEDNLYAIALFEALNVPAQSDWQATFVEQWRMQQIGHGTKLLAQLID